MNETKDIEHIKRTVEEYWGPVEEWYQTDGAILDVTWKENPGDEGWKILMKQVSVTLSFKPQGYDGLIVADNFTEWREV